MFVLSLFPAPPLSLPPLSLSPPQSKLCAHVFFSQGGAVALETTTAGEVVSVHFMTEPSERGACFHEGFVAEVNAESEELFLPPLPHPKRAARYS